MKIRRSLTFQFTPGKLQHFNASKLKSVKEIKFVSSFKIRKKIAIFKYFKFVKSEFANYAAKHR